MNNLIPNFKQALLVFFLLFVSNSASYAQIAGGDITWKCVGKDSFIFELTLYNDCNDTTLGDASIFIDCKTTGNNLGIKNITVPSPIDISPVCNNSCTKCNSSGCSFQYGIQKYVYTSSIVDLQSAGSCCDIILSYNSCCRSTEITTGISGAFYTEAVLNRCLSPCDNSPVFTNYPILITCIGMDYVFNHGVIDSDTDSLGSPTDSLAYSWTTPLNALSSPANYTSPYSYDKPIMFSGFPNTNMSLPGGFHLDSITGTVKFQPTTVQQSVMALKVSEYRKGVLIGEITRDLQIIIILCPNNLQPDLTGPYLLQGSLCRRHCNIHNQYF